MNSDTDRTASLLWGAASALVNYASESGLDWLETMAEFDAEIASIIGVNPESFHGIRKTQRSAHDTRINIPSTISAAAYYRVMEQWDGSIRLVPVKEKFSTGNKGV